MDSLAREGGQEEREFGSPNERYWIRLLMVIATSERIEKEDVLRAGAWPSHQLLLRGSSKTSAHYRSMNKWDPEGRVAFHSFLSVPVGRDAEGPGGIECPKDSLITGNRDIDLVHSMELFLGPTKQRFTTRDEELQFADAVVAEAGSTC